MKQAISNLYSISFLYDNNVASETADMSFGIEKCDGEALINL